MTGYLTNEKGAVMLFTMMFVLLITVMGLIAFQTSVFEIRIAENYRRYSEEFAGAELALNHAIVNFRNQATAAPYDIGKVLNDNRYPSFKSAVYINDSPQTYPGGGESLARIEIRRIVREARPQCDGEDSDSAVCALSEQANNVPRLPHRYYAGAIDKRRFAVTATAYRRNSSHLSTTWVQKGVSLPVEQDKDIF